MYETSGARPVVLSYLKKRARGEFLNTDWKLSRIIWRAGELEIEEAVPAIKALMHMLQGQELYAAVWTLGRIGDEEAMTILQDISLDPESLHYHIHLGALVKHGGHQIRNKIIDMLPSHFKAAYVSKSFKTLNELLQQGLQNPKEDASYLLPFYFLSFEDASLSTLFYKILVDIDVRAGKWKYLRYIYKVAEMIKDWKTFGLIARLVNLRPANFRKNRWSNREWVGNRQMPRKEALSSKEPRLAFSNSTKDYFIRRTLRRLRKAGVDKMEAYCAFAAGILIAYRESDAANEFSQTFYNYDWQTRRSSRTVHTYPPMAKVPYFYYILFAQGTRFYIPSKLQKFYAIDRIASWNYREDSFAELWDRYPQYAVKVLAQSKQRDAMNFGMKVLEGRSDLETIFSIDDLFSMLSSPFIEVLEFSLDYIEKKYNPQQANEAIILKLIETENGKAVQLAIRLLDKNPAPFNQNVAFIKEGILSTQLYLHAWLREHIKESSLERNAINDIVDHCLAAFTHKTEHHKHTLPQETLVQVFPAFLKQLDASKILELINHDALQVQLFGAKLINLNERKTEE
ncbi:MAG: hypothetical protein AAGK97_10680, partial [Bacteroidota bacterium]